MKDFVAKRSRPAIRVGVGLSLLAFGAPLVGTASAAHIACGTTITANTTLHSNIGPCSGDGIIVGANNITLNLNGHEIFGTDGDGGGNQAGIRVPFKSGVSIVGKRRPAQSAGTIRGFDAGVFVNGGSGNTIKNLVVRDNIGPLTSEAFLGDGIVLFKSADNQIVDNIVRNNGRYNGIGVLGLGANNNTIRGNIVEDNVGISEAESPPVGPGFIPHYINAPGHGIIVNHFLDQPIGTSEAIYGNKVMNNTVRLNDGSGISTVANIDGIITGNVVEDNSPQYYGDIFRLFGDFPPSSVVGIGVTTGSDLELDQVPHNVLVRDNVVKRNGLVGILIRAADNTVQNNQVFDNGLEGISVYEVNPGNSIQFNSTGGNLLWDLVDYNYNPNCAGNRWWGNTWSDELGALAIEFGFDAPYYPECVTDGPSGKGPKVSSAARNDLPPAVSQQQPTTNRGLSGRS